MKPHLIRFIFLNIGHLLDHYVVLIFATVAALKLTTEWNMSYAELIPYATPGLIAFGVGAFPAGWLADRWSRKGMMVIFFIGIGLKLDFGQQSNITTGNQHWTNTYRPICIDLSSGWSGYHY